MRKYIKKINALPWVTYLLLGINVVVFLGWLYLKFKLQESDLLSSDQAETMAALLLGAESQPLVWQEHEFFRLFTAMFVHFGVMHLLFNCVFLYSIGQVTEHVFGHLRYFILYIVSGLAGDVLAMLMKGTTIVAGASGALFGLLGIWTILWLKYRKHPNFILDDYGKEMFTLAVVNIILNFTTSGVSISGHLGGFIGGALVGILVLNFFKPKVIIEAEK